MRPGRVEVADHLGLGAGAHFGQFAVGFEVRPASFEPDEVRTVRDVGAAHLRGEDRADRVALLARSPLRCRHPVVERPRAEHRVERPQTDLSGSAGEDLERRGGADPLSNRRQSFSVTASRCHGGGGDRWADRSNLGDTPLAVYGGISGSP